MGVARPDALHVATEEAFNRSDLDALVSLYADDGCLVDAGGSVASGMQGIRDAWAGFVSLGGTMTMTTRYCIERGSVALLSNAWHFTSDALTLGSVSAEIAVRGDDGLWRYLVDHPSAGQDPA